MKTEKAMTNNKPEVAEMVTECCESPNYLTRTGKNGTFYVCEYCYHSCDLIMKAQLQAKESKN